MSGTSMDGIDLALVQSDGLQDIVFGPFATIAHEAGFKKTGFDICCKLSVTSLDGGAASIHHHYADFAKKVSLAHARALQKFLQQNSLSRHEIDYLAFHGQTVLHRPQNSISVQLGDAELLAQRSGIAVIYDFRSNDMLNGGQGAPLVPIFHHALAKRFLTKYYRKGVFVNIGGVANLTFLPDISAPLAQSVRACDCGPGNALIDDMMRRSFGKDYDDKGKLAFSGKVDEDLVKLALGDSYFLRDGVKSLDRNSFSDKFFHSLAGVDSIATLSAFSADAMALAIKRQQPDGAFVAQSGGGRHNMFIRQRLATALPKHDVFAVDDFAMNGDAIEAQALAYLGARSLLGLPLTFPLTTGVKQDVSGGRFTKNHLSAKS